MRWPPPQRCRRSKVNCPKLQRWFRVPPLSRCKRPWSAPMTQRHGSGLPRIVDVLNPGSQLRSETEKAPWFSVCFAAEKTAGVGGASELANDGLVGGCTRSKSKSSGPSACGRPSPLPRILKSARTSYFVAPENECRPSNPTLRECDFAHLLLFGFGSPAGGEIFPRWRHIESYRGAMRGALAVAWGCCAKAAKSSWQLARLPASLGRTKVLLW